MILFVDYHIYNTPMYWLSTCALIFMAMLLSQGLRGNIIRAIGMTAIGLTLCFGPMVGTAMLPGMVPAKEVQKLTTVRYAPEYIDGTRIDVLLRHDKESTREKIHSEKILERDIQWMSKHPKEIRVSEGKLNPYPARKLEKILYQMALPLPQSMRPGVTQKYEKIAKGRSDLMLEIEYGTGGFLALWIAGFLSLLRIGKVRMKNLDHAEKLIDGQLG